jgi:hypothetical protein
MPSVQKIPAIPAHTATGPQAAFLRLAALPQIAEDEVYERASAMGWTGTQPKPRTGILANIECKNSNIGNFPPLPPDPNGQCYLCKVMYNTYSKRGDGGAECEHIMPFWLLFISVGINHSNTRTAQDKFFGLYGGGIGIKLSTGTSTTADDAICNAAFVECCKQELITAAGAPADIHAAAAVEAAAESGKFAKVAEKWFKAIQGDFWTASYRWCCQPCNRFKSDCRFARVSIDPNDNISFMKDGDGVSGNVYDHLQCLLINEKESNSKKAGWCQAWRGFYQATVAGGVGTEGGPCSAPGAPNNFTVPDAAQCDIWLADRLIHATGTITRLTDKFTEGNWMWGYGHSCDDCDFDSPPGQDYTDGIGGVGGLAGWAVAKKHYAAINLLIARGMIFKKSKPASLLGTIDDMCNIALSIFPGVAANFYGGGEGDDFGQKGGAWIILHTRAEIADSSLEMYYFSLSDLKQYMNDYAGSALNKYFSSERGEGEEIIIGNFIAVHVGIFNKLKTEYCQPRPDFDWRGWGQVHSTLYPHGAHAPWLGPGRDEDHMVIFKIEGSKGIQCGTKSAPKESALIAVRLARKEDLDTKDPRLLPQLAVLQDPTLNLEIQRKISAMPADKQQEMYVQLQDEEGGGKTMAEAKVVTSLINASAPHPPSPEHDPVPALNAWAAFVPKRTFKSIAKRVLLMNKTIALWRPITETERRLATAILAATEPTTAVVTIMNELGRIAAEAGGAEAVSTLIGSMVSLVRDNQQLEQIKGVIQEFGGSPEATAPLESQFFDIFEEFIFPSLGGTLLAGLKTPDKGLVEIAKIIKDLPPMEEEDTDTYEIIDKFIYSQDTDNYTVSKVATGWTAIPYLPYHAASLWREVDLADRPQNVITKWVAGKDDTVEVALEAAKDFIESLVKYIPEHVSAHAREEGIDDSSELKMLSDTLQRETAEKIMPQIIHSGWATQGPVIFTHLFDPSAHADPLVEGLLRTRLETLKCARERGVHPVTVGAAADDLVVNFMRVNFFSADWVPPIPNNPYFTGLAINIRKIINKLIWDHPGDIEEQEMRDSISTMLQEMEGVKNNWQEAVVAVDPPQLPDELDPDAQAAAGLGHSIPNLILSEEFYISVLDIMLAENAYTPVVAAQFCIFQRTIINSLVDLGVSPPYAAQLLTSLGDFGYDEATLGGLLPWVGEWVAHFGGRGDIAAKTITILIKRPEVTNIDILNSLLALVRANVTLDTEAEVVQLQQQVAAAFRGGAPKCQLDSNKVYKPPKSSKKKSIKKKKSKKKTKKKYIKKSPKYSTKKSLKKKSFKKGSRKKTLRKKSKRKSKK